jgi:DNA-binding NarL/FixJ family response regulator
MTESPYNSSQPAVAVTGLLPESVRFQRMKDRQSLYAMTQVTRILLVDDHQIVRVGLAQYIATHDDLQVSAEAGSGDEAIQLVRKQEFDVVVLDISMPDKNGIDTLHIIKRIKPDLHVLVLSGHSETHYAVNTLRAGASGYVCKDAPPEEFIRAIRVVARGRRYLSEAAADLVSDQLMHRTDKMVHETLSEREFQIFRKLAAGQSPTTVADELHISVKTVSTYRTRVLEKMGLKTNADLTYYAIKNALID